MPVGNVHSIVQAMEAVILKLVSVIAYLPTTPRLIAPKVSLYISPVAA